MAKDKIESEEQNILTIEIKYKDAISLSDFNNSMDGWYNQYNQHLEQMNFTQDKETLFIKRIKHGSIIVELFSSPIPLLNAASTIVSFFTSMKLIIDWLATKKGQKPKYTLDELENIRQIIAPVKTIDNSIKLSISGDNNSIIINQGMKEEIAKNINAEIAELSVEDEEEPIPHLSVLENVTLKFTQVENAKKNNKNTKGKIISIDNNSYPILFSEGLKSQVNTGKDNPLIFNYLVNVRVHIENDKIKSYTVLKIIDSYKDEEIDKSLFPDNEIS